MKKILALFVVTIMVLGLVACGSTAPSATNAHTDAPAATDAPEATDAPSATDEPISTDDPADTEIPDLAGVTIEDGVLMVGMEMGYPPMEYIDKDGTTPIGFEVDFCKKMGEYLNLEVKLINTAWDGIFASLDSNRYDIVASACSITPDRQKNYEMTKAHIANRLVLVTKKDSDIKSPADLAGHTCATQSETTSDYYMRDLMANGTELSDYFVYDQVIQCFEELKFGRVDAVLTDSVVAAYYIGTDSDKFATVWENDEAEPMGIVMKKGNTVLLDAIEKAIDKMYADGIVKEIAIKHFGYDTTEGVR